MSKTYDGQTGKFIATLLDAVPRNLSGAQMQQWIENPTALGTVLARALNRNSSNSKFSSWVTTNTGDLDLRQLIRLIENRDYLFAGEEALGLLRQIDSPAEARGQISLVQVTGKELGLKQKSTRATIYSRADQLGLALCPLDAVLSIGIGKQEQIEQNTMLHIATKALRCNLGKEHYFRLGKQSSGTVNFVIDADAAFEHYLNRIWIFSETT